MIVLIAFALINSVKCFDVESYEVNKVENDFSPFYNMIVYSDIVDILNDIDTKGGRPIEAIMRSESDSDENVDDLLSEYHRHIEKIAHDIESLKSRALPRRDRVFPTNLFNPIKLPQSRNPSFIDLPIPLDQLEPKPNPIRFFDSASSDDLIKASIRSFDTSPRKSLFDPSCFCRENKLPCICDCKLCIMPLDMMRQNSNEIYKVRTTEQDFRMPETSKSTDNTLNIKIKFEIQMPDTSNNIKGKHCKNHTKTASYKAAYPDDDMSIELPPNTVRAPSPFMQFPTPLDILGLNRKPKINRNLHFQKLGLNKKKKSKPNNAIKKHRKKVVTFHDIKFDSPNLIPLKLIPTRLIPVAEEFHPIVEQKNTHNRTGTNFKEAKESEPKTSQSTNTVTSITTEIYNDEKISVTLNLPNDRENATDEMRFGNQIFESEPETSREEPKINATNINKLVRRKRNIESITEKVVSQTTSQVDLLVTKLKEQKTTKDLSKKIELKNLLADSELLYWPINSKTPPVVNSKNITSLIMDRENKKTKLNISKDVLKNNHTKALEKAIFGDVNWDDMDAVAPIFMSFVGKYLRGVLTFCSDKICHSMKCAEKMCLHRTCNPDDRFNHKGHCAASNATDSVASMESIMDLPSNVAFEIVDILQEHMPGKIYGKGTLCISSKCISFVAAKKLFSKSRCSTKDLNTLGHCSNVKNFKTNV